MSLSETQEQILDAVMACIVRDGIDGASMRSVAREADVSLGLLSYHFDDKQSLIESAFQLACDRVLGRSMASIDTDADPAQNVRNFIRSAFHDEFLDAEYLALRLGLWAVSRTDGRIAVVERSLYLRYSDQIVRLITRAVPGLSVADAQHRATDVIVTQNGLWLNWARYRDQLDLERGLRRCEAIALERA